ncbi:MAG: phosphoribosyltransferase [Pseudomonadota bacterium]
MNFRSIWDLQQTIVRVSPLIKQFDLIVGVPRSGILAASLLSLSTNKPLADLNGFVDGRMLATGRTKSADKLLRTMKDVRTVLVLDDSIANGFAMTEARERTKHLTDHFDISYAAVYGERRSHAETDFVFEVVSQPRVFQWNFMHHDLLDRACVDIDGVLCPDPTPVENDDGARYETFLRETGTLHIPTRRIGHLVTNRLEKYRAPTEAWLRAQGIEYGHLHMNDAATVTERRAQPVGAFKAQIYRKIGGSLFIESEVDQAEAIAAQTGRPVLCTESWRIHLGDGAAALAFQGMSTLSHGTQTLKKRAKITAKRLVRSVVGQGGLDRIKSLARR